MGSELVVFCHINIPGLAYFPDPAFVLAFVAAGKAAACRKVSWNGDYLHCEPLFSAGPFEHDGHAGHVEGSYAFHEASPP